MNRRDFITAGLSTAAFGLSAEIMRARDVNKTAPHRVCLFTDHLDDFGYSYKDVASMLAQLSISGPDLTVRSGGLVAPERVVEELPRAAAVFADHGLAIPMISTGITAVDEATAQPTLSTMSKLGIRFFKLGYYKYGDATTWESELKRTRNKLTELINLGKEFDVVAGFHNHSGPMVGGAVWDLSLLLEGLKSPWIGSYFDPAQATIEGGKHAWKLGFQRLSTRLKMIAIKDFVWEKVGGRWLTRWVPLGEGMVQWPEFFRMLYATSFAGPISLHIEYDPGGRTRPARFENSLAAAERDLTFLRQRMTAVSGDGR